ncbi:MAG TPA: hypothetical protein ENK06_11820 [Gammaproteobacteria bacterium]|nr:hypothetical protein [Gammaproteobacteria bacterium]
MPATTVAIGRMNLFSGRLLLLQGEQKKIVFLLCLCLFSLNLHAQNLASAVRNAVSTNENALGLGYYNGPVVYKYNDATRENYLSDYRGWIIKYVRYFGTTSALNLHYLQANAKESIRELSGSFVYGLNLNRPGVGFYAGVSYNLKQRTQFAGERRVADTKDYGWDFPIGVQVQNALLTFSFETRYKYFVLQGDNVVADSVRYPLYFSVLMNF